MTKLDYRTTLNDFIKNLQDEVREQGEEFGNLPLHFHTSQDLDMHYLSVYDSEIEEIGRVVNIDIGYDDE